MSEQFFCLLDVVNSIEGALGNDFEKKGQIFKHLKNNYHHCLMKYVCTKVYKHYFFGAQTVFPFATY